MGQYTVVRPRNPSTDYTTTILLGKDSAGNDISVGIGGTAEMTEAQAATLSERFVLEGGGMTAAAVGGGEEVVEPLPPLEPAPDILTVPEN